MKNGVYEGNLDENKSLGTTKYFCMFYLLGTMLLKQISLANWSMTQ